MLDAQGLSAPSRSSAKPSSSSTTCSSRSMCSTRNRPFIRIARCLNSVAECNVCSILPVNILYNLFFFLSCQRVGWENSLALMRYGDRFRTIRKNVHQYLGTGNSMLQHHPMEETEARRFLLRVLKSPNKLADHIRTFVSLQIR